MTCCAPFSLIKVSCVCGTKLQPATAAMTKSAKFIIYASNEEESHTNQEGSHIGSASAQFFPMPTKVTE